MSPLSLASFEATFLPPKCTKNVVAVVPSSCYCCLLPEQDPSYLKNGYIAQDNDHTGASNTLEYAYDDGVLANIAQYLGHAADAAEFRNRSMFYKCVTDCTRCRYFPFRAVFEAVRMLLDRASCHTHRVAALSCQASLSAEFHIMCVCVYVCVYVAVC